MSSQSRQQRRAYEKWLKKTDLAKYKEWKLESVTRGKKIHEENTEKVLQSQSEYYENLQTQLIQSMRNEGKTDSEIDSYIEDWVKTIKVWGSKEKPIRMREIKRQKLNNDLVVLND
jgi:hypothetical protein